MRTVLVLLLAGLLIAFAFGARADSGAEKAAISAARVWLSLVDAGDYPGSWKEASHYFRGAVVEKAWVAELEGFRKPLGMLVSRKIRATQETTSLPGAPDGDYVVMKFETSFENKKSAAETVTFMLEKDGTWKAAGYFIK